MTLPVPAIHVKRRRSSAGQRAATRRRELATQAAEHRDQERAAGAVADLDADRRVYRAHLLPEGAVCDACVELGELGGTTTLWLTGDEQCARGQHPMRDGARCDG
jgi:hypothetical protein